jgi:O-antigen/teichoic acid export membrane protein
MVIAGLVESALRGAEIHGAATWPGRVLRPLLFLAFVVLLSLHGEIHDARWALGLNALAIALALIPPAITLLHHMPSPGARVEAPSRMWLTVSVTLGLNTLALHLNSQADMIVLGFFSDEATLGTYGAITRIVTVVTMSSVAVIAIVQPMIVSAHAAQRNLERLVRDGARLVFAAAAVVALTIMLFAGDLLAVFGEDFRGGATALRILAVGWMIGSLFSLAGPLLNMTGFERSATIIMALGAALNIVLNIALVPIFGINGAASATAMSVVIWNIALFWTARSRLGVGAFPAAGSMPIRAAG